MKKQLLTGALVMSTMAIGITGQSYSAKAASLGSCSTNIGALVGSGGIGASGFVGADSCQKSLAGNDSVSDVESLFTGVWTRAFKTNSNNTSSDEVFTQGNLALTYSGGAPSQSGTWSLSGLAPDVTSFILAVKGGNGNKPEAQSLLYYKFDDLDVLSGDWSTFGLRNNGGNQPDLSHISVYTNSTPIPTPALIPGLIGMGVAALRKKKQALAASQAD